METKLKKDSLNNQYCLIGIIRDDLILVEYQITKEKFRIPVKELIQFKPLMSGFSHHDQKRILALSQTR